MKKLMNLEGAKTLDRKQQKAINGGSQAGVCGECYYLHKCNPGVYTGSGSCQPC